MSDGFEYELGIEPPPEQAPVAPDDVVVTTPDEAARGEQHVVQRGAVLAEYEPPRMRLAYDADAQEHETSPQPEAIAAIEPGLALMQALPADFPLARLLQFVPDLALKRRVETAAEAALAVSVLGAAGVSAAEQALEPVRSALKAVEDGFEFPTNAAYQLHKRLTGLRGDFSKSGADALVLVGRRIVDENRRLTAEAEAERRRQQAEADRHAREDATRAAKEAERAQAPPAVVQTLTRQAQTAVAPPVTRHPGPAMASSSVVERWKARFQDVVDGEPNPCVADMTPEQQIEARALLVAIAQGQQPLAGIEINWSYWNKRAAAEKTTMAVPGLEAFDEGGLRAKRSAKR